MAQSLAELLGILPDLQPEDVEPRIRSIVRPSNGQSPDLSALAREIDTALDKQQITSYYYGLALRVSQSLKWALDCMTSRREPAVLEAAVDVLAFHLRQFTDSTVANFGGVDKFLAFVDKELSWASAKRLFKELSRRTPPPALVAVNDALLAAAFISSGSASSPPLNRLAPTLVQTLLTACSSNSIRKVLPRVPQLVSLSAWRKLVQRHPDLIAELVFIQLGEEPSNDWDNGGALQHPAFLEPCIELLLKSGTPAGPAFFHKFILSYAARLENHRPSSARQDVLGVDSHRVAKLNQYMQYHLDAYSDSAARATEALSVIGALRTLSKAEGRVGWELRDIQSTLLVVVKDFSRHPALWEPTLEHPDSPSDDIVTALLQLFKESLLRQITIQKVVEACQLAKWPRGARFPVVAVAYAAIGISLTMQPDASTIDKFPSCPVECLGTFQPSHCRRFFAIGMEAKGDFFLVTQTVARSYGSSYSYLRGIADGLNTFEGTELQQAVAASVHAAWLGAQRGMLNEKSTAQEGLADFRSNVNHFVNLAAKSSVAEKRLVYILHALRLCMLAQAPTQFLAILQAAALKYAKDPVVGPNLLTYLTYDKFLDFFTGPAGLYITKSLASSQSSLVEALRSWTKSSSDILLTILGMIKSTIFNPDSQASSSYMEFGRSIGHILRRRIKLLRVLHPVLTPDVHDAVAILLRPLHDVVLAWDRLKVLEQPDTLGFGWRDCIPTMLSTEVFVLEPRFADVVLAYLCELGDARMKLYRQGRGRLPLPTYDGEPPTYDTGELYDILPLNPVISRSGRKPGRRNGLDRFFSGVAAPASLDAYCQQVLFLPLNSRAALKRAMATMDPWHFHYTQFDRALTNYLYYSVDKAEVVRKIEKLLEHYDNEKNDYIFLVARHETVRIMVWASPSLRMYVERWLPASLWSLEQAKNNKPVVIDPSRWFPKKPFARRDEEPTLLEARNRTIEQSEFLASTLAPFFQRSSGYFSKLRLSITFTRRLAALAASWLLTSGGIPASDASPPPPPQDVVQIALVKVRLDAAFMSIHPNNQRFLAALVRATMDSLSDVDVATMIGGLLSRPDNAVAQQLAFACIRLARVVRPHLVRERGTAIIGNPELSSWHRQAVCLSLFAVMKQADALDFARTLIDFIGQQLAEDRKRMKSLDSAALKEFKPSIKVTTVKMVVDVLGEALSIGVLSSSHFGLLESVQMALPHSSVKVQVVQALGQLALRDYLFAPGRPSPGLQALVAQVKTGVQLSEGYDVTDADWQDMAQGTKTNIKLEAEHPVATTLLRAPVESFPIALARAYCVEVISPCLLGQISNRTKWLQAAVAREGAAFDIQATYDEEFNAAALFTHCCQFLSYPAFSPANCEPSSILDLVQRRATLFLNREPYRELLRLVKLHQPDDWQASDYGRTVVSLCSNATGDESASFCASIRALTRALLADDLPREAIELASGALTRIGEELLKPDNVAACLSPPPARSKEPFSPFATFLSFLSYAPAADRGTWSERVRPIVQHLTKIAETHAGSLDFQGTTRNYGALYDDRVLQLKVLLLPHPAYMPFAQAVDRHRKWTDALIQVVAGVLSQPSYHRLFPGPFTNFLGKSNRMTGDDALAMAELLLLNQNSTISIPCVELAVSLLQSYKQDIEGSTTGRSRLEVIRQGLTTSHDGIIRALAFGI